MLGFCQYWAGFLCVYILLSLPAYAATYGVRIDHALSGAADTCDRDHVQWYLNSASILNGDTLQCASGTYIWIAGLTLTKAVAILGAGCTLDMNNRATACTTILQDNIASGAVPMIDTKLVSNDNRTRIAYFEFENGGGASKGNGFITMGWTSLGGLTDDARFRIDHCFFDSVSGRNIYVYSVWGVVDHNTFNLTNADFALKIDYPQDVLYGDSRWNAATGFGGADFVFIENNTISRLDSYYAVVDSFAGARYVARFNTINNGWLEAHGTESSGRARGTRAVEAYQNTYTNSQAYVVNLRSGPLMVWGNSLTGTGSPSAAHLSIERTQAPFDNWSQALGNSGANANAPWDYNDAGNPQTTATVQSVSSSGTTWTVTMSGSPGWTTNQFSWQTNQSYVAYRSGCKNNGLSICGGLITANTSDMLTLEVGTNVMQGFTLNAAMGDTMNLNKVTHGFDAPCRSGGTLLVQKTVTSITRSGTTATATVTGHGYSTGDWVSIDGTDPSSYEGDYQITLDVVDPTNKFTYTLAADPGANTSVGGATKVPWTYGQNDQSTDQCYQWLNAKSGTNLTFSPNFYPGIIRANVHFYDYGGMQQTSASSPFDGTAQTGNSVGVGTHVSPDYRPTTCTTGVAYWATDEGEWDSTHAGADGRLYKCTSTDNWTAMYTPFAYPHPLTIDSNPIPPKTKFILVLLLMAGVVLVMRYRRLRPIESQQRAA